MENTLYSKGKALVLLTTIVCVCVLCERGDLEEFSHLPKHSRSDGNLKTISDPFFEMQLPRQFNGCAARQNVPLLAHADPLAHSHHAHLR